MGLKGFARFVEKYKIKDKIMVHNSLERLKDKIIAIDTNLYIYRYITAIRRKGTDLIKDGKIISHIIGFKRLIALLRRYNAIPIFVFDGMHPTEKNATIEKRHNAVSKAYQSDDFQRQFYISDDIIQQTIGLFNDMNVKWIYDISKEADMVISTMVRNGHAYAGLSSDMDMLAFGCKRLIVALDKNGYDMIYLNKLLSILDITHEQFITIASIAGCDYTEGIEGYGMIRAYEALKNNTLPKLPKHVINAIKIFKKRM